MLAANRPWQDLLWILLLRYPHDVLLPRAWDLQQSLTDRGNPQVDGRGRYGRAESVSRLARQ
jgi:hypothetical protein